MSTTTDRPKAVTTDEPIPDSWARLGHHPDLGQLQARYYAVTVRREARRGDGPEDVFVVRYAHPVNNQIVTREFAAREMRDGKWIPTRVARHGPSAFPASVGEIVVDPSVDAPTSRDRQILWDRYSDFLASETAFTRGDDDA